MIKALSAALIAAAALPANSALPPICRTVCWCTTFEHDPMRAAGDADAVLYGVALDRTKRVPQSVVRDSTGLLESSRARFLVDGVWKGNVPDTITVYTADLGGTCSFTLAANQRYVLFLYRARSGNWVAKSCSLSSEWIHADTLIKALGPLLRRRAA
jgi:hypothetical protein